MWSGEETPFGYDFWYQPRLNVMISTSWGAPKAFSKVRQPELLRVGCASLTGGYESLQSLQCAEGW